MEFRKMQVRDREIEAKYVCLDLPVANQAQTKLPVPLCKHARLGGFLRYRKISGVVPPKNTALNKNVHCT